MENAVQICRRLRLALEEQEYLGEITAVEPRELTVEIPVGSVKIISGDSLRPFSCRLEGLQPFHTMGLVPGGQVLLNASSIDFPGTDLEISLKLASETDLSVRAGGLFMPADYAQRLSYLQRALELSADKGVFSELLLNTGAPVPMDMKNRLSALAAAVREEDISAIETAAAECAGLGAENIPASDMVLSGAMAAYTALGCALGRNPENVDPLTEAVFRGAAGNTNREAAFQLALAAAGLADEEGCQLFRCLFSDRAYTTLLSASVSAAARSGGDWLSGAGAFLQYFRF